MAYEPTRYELELRHEDGRAFLIAYSGARSASALRRIVFERWDAIEAKTGAVDEWAPVNRRSLSQGYQADGWTIRFSGRTQRDARTTGELPFVLDA